MLLVAVGRRWSCFGPAPTSPNNGQKSLLLLQRAVEAIVPFSRPPQTLAARDRPTAGNTETVPHNLPRADEQPVRPVSSVGYPWRGDCPDPAQTRWFGLRTDDEWAIIYRPDGCRSAAKTANRRPVPERWILARSTYPGDPSVSARFASLGQARVFPGLSQSQLSRPTLHPPYPPLPSHHQGPCPS